MINAVQFFEYHIWATEKLLNYVEDSIPELYTEKIDSVFSSIQEAFEHIYTIDNLWFSRMQENIQTTKNASFLTIAEAKEKFRTLHNVMHSYLKAVDEGNIVVYKNSVGESFEDTIHDIMIHVVNHGTYHRGNITAMIRSLGFKSISTDLIFFLREKER